MDLFWWELERHLHRYLAEFDFRYSNRVRLDVDDEACAELAFKGIVGRSPTYRGPAAVEVPF
jgi:hypothetical protein